MKEQDMYYFVVQNFEYDGFMGKILQGEAPYTARFIKWTNDPGVALFHCSDSKKRLIPTFALIGDNSRLPKQIYTNKVYFGRPSHS